MALFMIERNFAESLNASAADLKAITEINNQTGVRWLQSFLSADKRRTYCLYEAKSGDAIKEAARRAGLPVDISIELAGGLSAGGSNRGHPLEVRRWHEGRERSVSIQAVPAQRGSRRSGGCRRCAGFWLMRRERAVEARTTRSSSIP